MRRIYMLMQINPLLQGVVLMVFSYLSSFTIIIPICLGMYLCLPYEIFITTLFNSKTNQEIAFKVEVLVVSLLFVTIVLNAFYKSKRTSKLYFWIMLTLQFSLVETAGFYWYWGEFLNYRGDGQLIFCFYNSFQYTSLVFVPVYFIQWIFDKIPFHRWLNRKTLSTEEQKIIFNEKVQQLVQMHQNDSDENLKGIIEGEGWIDEAKEAAKQILKDKGVIQ
jgi:hypothetical protein